MFLNNDAERPSRSSLRLGIACMATMVAVGTVFMNQAIFVEIAKSYLIPVDKARFAFSVISLCYSFTFLWAGPLADTFDCRKITAAGLGVIAFLLFGISWVHEYAWFLACMGVMGVAAAVVPASMFPYVARLSSSSRSGVQLGAVVAAATLGIVVGRVALGAFSGFMGWEGAYRLFAFVFVFLAIICLSALDSPAKKVHRTRGIPSMYAELLKMVINPGTFALLLTGFFLFFGFLGGVTFLTYRLAVPPFSFNAAQIGYISLAGVTAVIAPFAGGLANRFGTYRIIIPGLILCFAALQVMCWSSSVVYMTVGVLLLFLGVYACQPLLFLLIGRHTPLESMGCASSLYILFCIGGGSLSSFVLGDVWKAYGWIGVITVCSGSILLALIISIVTMLCRKKVVA